MCGIWLYCTHCPRLCEKYQLFRSYSAIKHRGPDRSRFLEFDENPAMFIGFHRLAIMDNTTKGDQPHVLEYNNRSISSICNGEIYNFRDLIKKYNLPTQSHADTEVIPYLYEILGFEKMLKELEGEFAILIVDVDHENQRTVINMGRDRFGIRPLFYGFDSYGFGLCSEFKGLLDVVDVDSIRQFPSGSYVSFEYPSIADITDFFDGLPFDRYYDHTYSTFTIFDLEEAKNGIRKHFEQAVHSMLSSDRPLGALLSGGLDSSLVVACCAKYLKDNGGQKLKTFSIGLPGGTDRKYAEMVAEYCQTDHTHIELQQQDFLDAIYDIIGVIETYDITTVRASVGQYLVSKWISQKTNIKVLLIGDGSDEMSGGYKYFHKAPSPMEFHKECARLLSDIHFFDVLRADRGIASNGLEARVPFLAHKFVDYYLSIDPALRMVKNGCEKWLLRESFIGYLPNEVLFRSKEAFSDGVSGKEKSWFEIIQESANKKYSDSEFIEYQSKYQHCPPPSKEALLYRKIFEEKFNNCKGLHVPYFWLPKWCGDTSEPSARTLDVYS